MKTKELVLTSFLAILSFLSSYFTLYLGPVPFTLQTALVALCAFLLPKKLAALSQGIHALLLILFKGLLSSVTLGFVLGFIVAAYVMSAIVSLKKQSILFQYISGLIGILIIYCLGLSYFLFLTQANYTLPTALQVAIIPFIIPDLIKLTFAIFLANYLKKTFRLV